MPGAGGTVRWTKLAGRFRAFEVLVLGDKLSAQAMKEIGIVYKIVPSANLEEETRKIATKVSELPAVAVNLIKKSIQNSLELPELVATEWERSSFASLFSTKDKEIGVKAFVEKTKAKFTGE